jgi:hypothetical protein
MEEPYIWKPLYFFRHWSISYWCSHWSRVQKLVANDMCIFFKSFFFSLKCHAWLKVDEFLDWMCEGRVRAIDYNLVNQGEQYDWTNHNKFQVYAYNWIRSVIRWENWDYHMNCVPHIYSNGFETFKVNGLGYMRLILPWCIFQYIMGLN